MSVNLQMTNDAVTPDLQKLLKSTPAVRKIAGMAIRNVLIAHFRKKNSKPNKLGGTRTNFWLTVANSCSAPVTSGSDVIVRIAHPHVAIHVRGGTITPKKARCLTIPVVPEAHGKSPRSFGSGKTSGLEYRPWGLAVGERTYYVFKQSVKIPKDAAVLPPDGEVVKAINRAVSIWQSRQNAQS